MADRDHVISRRAALLAAVASRSMTGCQSPEPAPAGTDSPPASSEAFDPALEARLFLPETDSPAPLVVLVPGGGWTTADPSGLVPLAELLAGQGYSAATITYRAAAAGEFFPVPAEDVVCGVAAAGQMVTDERGAPESVIVLGHSAGAHLAALAALAPDDLTGDCEYAPTPPDGVIGLAGPYDVAAIGDATLPLFGPGVIEDRTPLAANPAQHTDERPDVPVLLVHGLADTIVPSTFATDFAAQLDAGGHDVTTNYLEDVDHGQVFLPDVIGSVVLGWLDETRQDLM